MSSSSNLLPYLYVLEQVTAAQKATSWPCCTSLKADIFHTRTNTQIHIDPFRPVQADIAQSIISPLASVLLCSLCTGTVFHRRLPRWAGLRHTGLHCRPRPVPPLPLTAGTREQVSALSSSPWAHASSSPPATRPIRWAARSGRSRCCLEPSLWTAAIHLTLAPRSPPRASF